MTDDNKVSQVMMYIGWQERVHCNTSRKKAVMVGATQASDT